MAGLDWFELDVDFHDDPKVKALASRLRQPLADSYVSRLYAYCYKYTRDRFDPSVAADTIEEAVRWKGRRGVLFDALFAVEVLEREAGKVVVHGVADRLAPHIAHRAAAAERQRRKRAKVAELYERDQNVTRDVPRDVPRDVTPNVTPLSRPNKNRNSNKETKAASAPPETVKPLAIHLQAQCPDLAALLQRATLPVEVGHRATVWGEADGIIRQAGADAVLACWVASAAKRGGEGAVPLAYLIHPMRDLVKRGATPSRGPQPVSQDFSETLDDVVKRKEAERGRPA